MLSINDLNLQYGSKHIFRNVAVQIHTGDRVGLAGVTTVLLPVANREVVEALEGDVVEGLQLELVAKVSEIMEHLF